MPLFTYTALDKSGGRQRGRIDAPSRDAARAKLLDEQLNPLAIEPVKEATNLEDIVAKYRDVKPDTLVYFTRQLATMVGSGISPMRALATLEEQEANPKFREILRQVGARVEAGEPLNVAFAEHPLTFDRLFVAMVRSGEEAGNLPGALRELAVELEKNARLRKAVKSATLYPRIVLIFAFLIISGLMLFIVPKFANLFKTTVASTYTPGTGPPPSTALPGLTQMVVDVSHLLYPDKAKNLEWYGEVFLRFIGLIVIIFLLRKLTRYILRQPGPRAKWDAYKLRAPMRIGPLVQKIVVARFSRTFASLLRAGVPAVEALQIVADTSGNVIVADAVLKAREQMLAGATINEPLARSGAFPVIVTRMIEIGEETGELELMLLKVAEFFEEEVELQIQGLTSLLEPLMIMIVGGAVGIIIIAIYLPMFSIYNKIGTGMLLTPWLINRLRLYRQRWHRAAAGGFDVRAEAMLEQNLA